MNTKTNTSTTSNTLKSQLPHYLRLMRWDKPIGFFLLLWPTLWALWLAAAGRPDTTILLIFVAGVVLMRSAGCVMNDIADRRFDGHVERTRTRPLAAGAVSLREAIGLFTLLCFICFVLVWLLNPLTRWLAVVGLLLTIIYPFMKRYIDCPQAFLGLAFSWGIPMAFAAQQGQVPPLAWGLFSIAVLWPVAYDTLYAMVDQADDEKIGVRSSAILFGRFAAPIAIGLQLIMLALLAWLGAALGLGVIYYVSLVVASGLCVAQYRLARTREPRACFRAFLNSHWVGATVFVGLVLSVA